MWLERERERGNETLPSEYWYLGILLSQKTEWARAVSFLKKGIVLGLIYAMVTMLWFNLWSNLCTLF